MTVSFEEAEKIRAEYRKMMAEKKAKKETKAKLPDESVSSSKSEPLNAPDEEKMIELGKEVVKAAKEHAESDPVLVKPKKKRGRPKKKKD